MRRLSAAFLLVVSFLPPAAAATPRPQTERERRVARGLAIVDEALASASSLRLSQNRLRMRLAIFDTLWEYDRERARRVVADAVADLNAYAEGTPDPARSESGNRRSLAASLRQQMLYSLVQRDPDLALDALRQSRAAAMPANGAYDSERELELQIAAMASAASPKRALELAEQSLAGGLSYNLVSVIEQARQNDPEGASRLAGEVYDRIRSARFLDDQIAALLAVYLAADGMRARGSDDAAKPLLAPDLSRALRDRLYETVLTFRAADANAERVATAVNLASNVSGSLGPLDAGSSGAAASLARKVEELQAAYARMTGASSSEEAEPAVPENATADQLVEAAASAPEGSRDSLIYAAAEKAREGGDADRARSIVESHVSDPEMRRQLVENIDRSSLYDAVSHGRVEQARALVARIAEPSERVTFLIQIAQSAGLAERTPASLGLLAEADAIAGERAANESMFSARLTLAQAYAAADPGRAFSIVETSADQLNGLFDAAAGLEGFGCERQFEDGELLMFDGGRLSTLAASCVETIGALAPNDLDRAAEAAGRFSRPETRSLALLAVAKVMLATPSSPEPGPSEPATTTE